MNEWGLIGTRVYSSFKFQCWTFEVQRSRRQRRRPKAIHLKKIKTTNYTNVHEFSESDLRYSARNSNSLFIRDHSFHSWLTILHQVGADLVLNQHTIPEHPHERSEIFRAAAHSCFHPPSGSCTQVPSGAELRMLAARVIPTLLAEVLVLAAMASYTALRSAFSAATSF